MQNRASSYSLQAVLARNLRPWFGVSSDLPPASAVPCLPPSHAFVDRDAGFGSQGACHLHPLPPDHNILQASSLQSQPLRSTSASRHMPDTRRVEGDGKADNKGASDDYLPRDLRHPQQPRPTLR